MDEAYSENEVSDVEELDDNELFFHPVHHGRNIKLEDQGKVAQKIKKGAKEAALVTNRPLQENELLEVELGAIGAHKGVKQEVKQMFKGRESIRIGVTLHSPSEIVTQNAQHSMKRMECKTWMVMGEQVVICGEVTMTLPKHSLKEVAIGDRVGIVRLPEFQGSVVMYINEAPVAIIATNVPDNLYGFIELQDCESVSLTPNTTVEKDSLPQEIKVVREKEEEIEGLTVNLAERAAQVDMLEGQLEMLRKQVLRSRSVSQRSITNNCANKQDSNMRDSETQTDEVLANGGSSSMTATHHQTTQQSCCVIS